MKIRNLLLAAVFPLFLGCGSDTHSFNDNQVIREATDLPDSFQEPVTAGDEESCQSPLTDPRDGTTLSFIRSSWPLADYQVPTGKYGVQNRELLRVNCKTGEVVGIVKR